jgi:hypothetical protein
MGGTSSSARSSWTSTDYREERVPVAKVIAENKVAVERNDPLDPRVDPKVKPIRESISLPGELAMDWRTWVDHTGSMGQKIFTIYEALERQNFLLCHEHGPQYLGKYAAHIALALFGDVENANEKKGDPHAISVTEYENEAQKIVAGLRLLRVDHGGGDHPEDPQLALEFCRSYTRRDSNLRGQRGYEFFVTDAPGRDTVRVSSLKRVFGVSHIQSNMDTQTVADLLKKQVFLVALLVDPSGGATEYWSDLCGPEYVVQVPDERYIPEVSAVVTGLTEGVVTHEEVASHLVKYANLDQGSARQIQNAVAAIPFNAQNQQQAASIDEAPVQPDENEWL